MSMIDHLAQWRRSYFCQIRHGPRFSMRGGTDDRHVIFEVYVKRIYDAARIKPGDIVIDIGANIGSYSLLAAQFASRILAFEPYPDNFTMLRKNLEINQTSNVETFPVAVAGESGKRDLFLPDDEFLSGRMSLYP